MNSFARGGIAGLLMAAGFGSQGFAAGDVARGKALFQQSCAICHADTSGPGGAVIVKQGPSLVDVVGRHAASGPAFNYTEALTKSRLVWDEVTLEHFLANPNAAVPGTAMPISVTEAADRRDLVAYLATLKAPKASTLAAAENSMPSAAAPKDDPNDWHHAAPGVKHHFTLADLPPPYATKSSGNGPKTVPRPAGALLAVPAGFEVRELVSGLQNPRIVRVAPNGDIFIAETAANRIRVLRVAGGADTPSENQIFASGLDRPFGIAFYPPGDNPQWVYVANNNSVVRFPYHGGDLQATGAAQVIVPTLTESHGGHSTRDVAFSPDGKRMFISVGSGSNVAEEMPRQGIDFVRQWEVGHGLGAAWGPETNRADILVTDPEGKSPPRTFATGIRNGVGIAVSPDTGELWTATNERDGLGDNLPNDYVTHVQEGAFYGWPWYYLGGHEDPRHAGERPDLKGKIAVPDVLFQSHSAPLEMCFYNPPAGAASTFPAEYRGDIFVALHGSWNRSERTGYKIVRVRMNHGVATGAYEDFLTGFVVDDRGVWGRPVGVAVANDGALLFTDDAGGTLWRIAPKKGEW